MRCGCRHRILTEAVRVGDVFKAHGSGPKGRAGTRYWLVLAVRDNAVHMAGLDVAGAIVSTTSYGLHVLHQRQRIAHVKGVAEFAAHLQGKTPA